MNDSDFYLTYYQEIQAAREIYGLPPLSSAALQLWRDVSCRVSLKEARSALRNHLAHSTECPTPGHLRKIVQFLDDTARPSPDPKDEGK